MAKLYFKYGTMKSGKSIDLIKTYHNYKLSDRNVIVAKPVLDTRSESNVSSRMGSSVPCMLLTGEKEQLIKQIKNENFMGNEINAVLVDEAQFLSLAQIMELTLIVDEMNIPVICYGLKTNFRSELFEGSKVLLEMADKIEEIKTVCQYCESKAILNMRAISHDGKKFAADPDGNEILIGDEEYIQVCRNHFFHYNTKGVEIP